MKLLLVGPPRTATRSLWHTLSKHPEIARAKQKEPLNYTMTQVKVITNPSKYLECFKINNNTKVLMDTTPSPYLYNSHLTKLVIEHNNLKPKIMYPVRRPIDRLYSTIKMLFVVKNKNLTRVNTSNYPPFMQTEPLDFIGDNLLNNLGPWLDSELLNSAYKITKEILIIRFDAFDFERIFRFLDIPSVPIEKFIHLNKLEMWNSLQVPKAKVDEYFKFGTGTRNELNKLCLKELKILKEVYNVYVDDWISETEEEINDYTTN